MDEGVQAGWVMLVGIVIWCVGAWFGFQKAVANGYPQWAAALGGLLLGPFAPLLALVKPNGKKCPHCTSVIPTEARVCPKCQRDQPRT